MPECTLLTALALAVVAGVVAELVYFMSGIFRTVQYWCSMVIIFAFQILVDGLAHQAVSAPIVIYNHEAILRLRARPGTFPSKTSAFAMVTLAILLWHRWLDRRRYPRRPKMRPEPVELTLSLSKGASLPRFDKLIRHTG